MKSDYNRGDTSSAGNNKVSKICPHIPVLIKTQGKRALCMKNYIYKLRNIKHENPFGGS
jgi:hypothetical protein